MTGDTKAGGTSGGEMSLTMRDVPLARQGIGVGERASGRVVDRVARTLTVAAVVVAALLAAGAFGLALYGHSHDNRLYEGMEVAGVDVGGMSRAEAGRVIAERYDEFAAAAITVEAAGQTFVIRPREAGAQLDLGATLDRAFAYGREGSFWDRSARWARALLKGTSLAPVIRLDGAEMDGQLETIAADVDQEPADAYVAMDSASPTLVADIPGLALDRDAARALLAGRYERLDGTPLSLPTVVMPAAVPADQLAGAVPGAQEAVAAPLVVSSPEGSWELSPEELREIVSVAGDGRVAVDRERVAAFVQSIAVTINQQAVDADIQLNDDLSLTVLPGRYSATVDLEATTDAAVEALLAGEHEAPVTIERMAPAITDADATNAIAEAEALIASGIALTWDGNVADGDAWLGRDDLVQALVIEPQPDADAKFSIVLDRWLLIEVMAPITEEIDVPAVDATFRLVDGAVKVVSKSSEGQELDAEAAAKAIVEAVEDGKPSIRLPVNDEEPKYTAADRSQMVVPPDLLGDSATYYGYSSEPRRQNVERAVTLEAGWLVPPDGVFSYLEKLGSVDESNGFTTGFGIVADEERGGVTTAPVIGGGICQVATTIFQAAFWAGLKIEERWQHPYWLQSYGQPPRGMKGLDAMVNLEDDWALDMKFRNNTDHWIAVVVIADGENVTAQILGTDPNWDVQVEGPILTNVVPKDDTTYYTDSPELPLGQELQVETALEGFDAEIRRTVIDENGEVVDEYVMTSSFAPSRNTILRGTGTGTSTPTSG
jgi:vancomycin resistance protein YoaR